MHVLYKMKLPDMLLLIIIIVALSLSTFGESRGASAVSKSHLWISTHLFSLQGP